MMGDNSGNSRRVAKNTLYLYMRMLIVMVVGLYTSRVILNTLGVENYGIYNVVGGVVVLMSFLHQALTNATYRFLTYDLGLDNIEKLKKTFSMSLNVHLILAGIVFLLAETVGLWILYTKLVIPDGRITAAFWAYQFSMISFCVSVIQTPYDSIIVAHEKMDFFAYMSIAEVFLKLVIVFALTILPGDKLIWYAFLFLFITVFVFFCYFILCKCKFEECTYIKYWDNTLVGKFVKYSGWSVVVNFVDIAVSQSIVFFFNIYVGVVANAALGVANQVNGKMNQFVNGFSSAFNPQIIKSYAKGDRNYFLNIIYSTSKLSYFLLLMLSFPIVYNIQFILDFWLGIVPEGTSLLVVYIVLFSLIDAYSAPLWIAAHANGNIKTHQLLMASIKIVNIPLAFFLLKYGCPAWSALATKAALNLVCSIVRPIYMTQLILLPLMTYVKKVFLPIILVTVLSVPLPYYLGTLYEQGWVRIFVTAGCFFVIASMAIMSVGLSSHERNMALIMLKIKKREE